MTDPFELLHAKGARFVLCSGKRPLQNNWLKGQRPSSTDVWNHLKDTPKAMVGIVPASIGCIVFDEDNGRHAEVVKEFGQARYDYESTSGRGKHFWYQCKDATGFGKAKWQIGKAGGDLIASTGFVLVPNPDERFSALAHELEEADPTAPQGRITLAAAVSVANKQNAAMSDPWAEGTRNDTLNTEAFKLGSWGKGRKALAALIERARDSGLSNDEIQRTAESGYQAGVKWRADRVIIGEVHMLAVETEALERVGTAIRWNLRAGRVEMKHDGRFYPRTDWYAAEDRSVSRVRRDIGNELWVTKSVEGVGGRAGQKPLVWSKTAFDDILLAHAARDEVDPFLDYLEALPAWDKTPRVDTWICDLFGATNDPLTRWASSAIFLASVKRTVSPGYKFDHVIILSGRQGLGKSSAVRHILPSNEFFSDSIDLSASNKECVENAGSAVICELSDLQGSSRADLERLKAFITRQHDTFRGAYMRYSEDKMRRWIMVGTTNSETPLPADEENRRFVVIPVNDPGQAVETHLAEIRDQMWAEAYARVTARESVAIPRELIPVQESVNLEFARTSFVDDCWETLLLIKKANPGIEELWNGSTVTSIRETDDRLRSFSTKAISQAFTRNGWYRRFVNRERVLVKPSEEA